MSSKTYYKIEWENPDIFSDFAMWITKGKDSNSSRCKYCLGASLKLDNMGETALNP